MDELARLGDSLHGDGIAGVGNVVGVKIEVCLLAVADGDAGIPVKCLAQVGALANAVVASVVARRVELGRFLIAERQKLFNCIVAFT